MLAISMKFDEKSFKEAAHILRAVPRAVPRVFRRVLNRTVDTAATDIKRRVSAKINIKKGDVSKALTKRKATYSNLTSSIGAREFRPGLLAFMGTRQTKRGVKYRISRTTGRKLIEHGFIQTMTSGHRGVFLRGGPSRLPIGEKKGPSIWRVITNTAGLLKAATDAAGEKMGKLINDQIGYEFKRWNR